VYIGVLVPNGYERILYVHRHIELRKIEMFLENTEVIYPNASFAMLYGETEYLIRKRGYSIYAMDLLIGFSQNHMGSLF
jgi:hypothetical protein